MSIAVCVVGAGRAGTVHALNLAFFVKGARVAAIADSDPQAAAKLAALVGAPSYPTLSEALEKEDVDAVCIATPTFAHAAAIIEAAEAGKHVFCEKPLCVTLEEADRIEAAVRQHDVIFQIGFMRRFDENYLRARELLEQGAIGEPILVKSVGRGPSLPPEWYCDPKKSNGLLAEVNSHDFDAMRWLMGREISRVYAVAGNFKCPHYRTQYPHFYDAVIVSLTFEDGSLGLLDGACPATYGYDARMEILGTEGVLFIGSQQATSVLVWNRNGELVTAGHQSWRTLFREAYRAELEHFIECIQKGTTPRVGLDDGRKALEAVLAANTSIHTGVPVDVAAIRTRPAAKGSD